MPVPGLPGHQLATCLQSLALSSRNRENAGTGDLIMLRFAASLAAALLLATGLVAPVAAQGTGGTRDRTFYLSAYVSQWAESRLLELPGRLVTGDLKTRDAYFAGGGLGYVLVPRFEVPLPFCGGCALRGNSVEVEGVLLKHFNRQDHWEMAAGAFLRSGQIPLLFGAELNLAAGTGLSYAFSDPDLEIGKNGQVGVDTYRLQFYLAFETELAHEAIPGWNLVGRIHHRSGAYGVLTPQRSGSNFIGLGLRRGF
jgi:hypothetical protein